MNKGSVLRPGLMGQNLVVCNKLMFIPWLVGEQTVFP